MNTSFTVSSCNSLVSPLGGKGAELLSFSGLLIASFLKGFSDSLVGKESTCNAGDPVLSLGQEDPLEKGMATYSSILA